LIRTFYQLSAREILAESAGITIFGFYKNPLDKPEYV